MRAFQKDCRTSFQKAIGQWYSHQKEQTLCVQIVLFLLILLSRSLITFRSITRNLHASIHHRTNQHVNQGDLLDCNVTKNSDGDGHLGRRPEGAGAFETKQELKPLPL